MLLIGVLGEGLIDIFWPEPMRMLRRWSDGLKLTAVVAAFLFVFAGLGMEWIYGTKADDVADQIHADLQERALLVSPRLWFLTPPAMKHIVDTLKPFRGQKFATFANVQTADDRDEVFFFAMSLDAMVTGQSVGWLDPSGKTVGVDSRTGRPTNLGFDPPDRTGVNGVLIECAREAPPRVKAAANAFGRVLESEHIFAYVHTESSLAALGIASNDVVAMTVGRRYELFTPF